MKKNMINVIFCGYRKWAKEIFCKCYEHKNVHVVKEFHTNDEFLEEIAHIKPEGVDMILFIGWSWIISQEITSKFLCLGIHPSDLPLFRGGSPIQHQIIRGVVKSKVTLMTLSDDKIDSGDIWMKEDLDLQGDNIEIVFQNIVESTCKLLFRFFDVFPLIQPVQQDNSAGIFYKRRKPEESRLSPDVFKNHSLLDIYNYIRSLTDPYPNAYLEDEFGNKLFFTGVKYVSNSSFSNNE